MIEDVKKQQDILLEAVDDVVSKEAFLKQLLDSKQRQKPLLVKAGFDPTAPHLHFGHAVLFRQLKKFQNCGHRVALVIGDFTARIGDPSGRSQLRPTLSKEEVQENASTYARHAFRLIDKDKTDLVYNSSWMESLSFSKILSLTSHYTVSRMLERDDFKKRFQENKAISVVEFMYPLMQGYDSVVLDSDIEIGGTDQRFNLLMGRHLQKAYGCETLQTVMMLPLLEGLDGVRKMSKSYGNDIGIEEEPYSMFAKIMSISDTLMWRYLLLLTDIGQEKIEELKKEVELGQKHPKKVKEELAKELVSTFHSEKEAEEARVSFDTIVVKGGVPQEIDDIYLRPEDIHKDEMLVLDVIALLGIFSSRAEVKRLIKQGAVRYNREKVQSIDESCECRGKALIQVGKRIFKNVIFP